MRLCSDMGGDNLDALCFAGQTVELPEALGLLEPEYVFLETGRVLPGNDTGIPGSPCSPRSPYLSPKEPDFRSQEPSSLQPLIKVTPIGYKSA
jgi:hypothetical protein